MGEGERRDVGSGGGRGGVLKGLARRLGAAGRRSLAAALKRRLKAPAVEFRLGSDYGERVGEMMLRPLTECPVCRGPLRYSKYDGTTAACFVTDATQGELTCVAGLRAVRPVDRSKLC
jgi:hypothetical protein